MSEDGFFSKKDLRRIVLLSATQVDRLEGKGMFPKRVVLGSHPTSRVGWVKAEILEWVRARIAARDAGS
jgi:predicted DNA-binding transcriptional regulator AlpA